MSSPDFGLTRVSDLVQLVLSTLVDVAAEQGVAIPNRQIAGAGVIPYDCEQVVVTVTQINTGAPETRSGVNTYPNAGANSTLYTVTLQIAIVRATSSGMTGPLGNVPPTADAYFSNLANASGDTSLLITAADRVTADLIAPVGATPRVVTIGAPSGGLIATAARVTALA